MADKETSLQKISRLTNNQEKIRNIATSAHIHHGKCIAGNSRVLLTDGSIKEAKEIYEDAAKDGEVYEDNEEHTIFIPKRDIEILSLNHSNIEKRKIQYVWRLKGGNTIKVALRNGFNIETTPEHKYLIYRDGFVYVEAKDIRLGDRIVCARNAESNFFWKEKNANTEDYNYIEVENNGLIQLIKNKYSDIAFVDITNIKIGFEEIVYDFTVPETHNFIAEGMVIHNTAFTDNLLAAAGLMAVKNAGDLEEGMATWQHADEQERLMTVDAANVSMGHSYQGEEYLINLIDTPGHVDFGGNVTRAMRAIDGTFVLICAVEGIMPQTETVVRQALRERVKPVLFINKVDRLIKELKLTPEKIQERFFKLVTDFNHLIMQIAEQEYKEKWQVSVNDGSVAFGSARENWAVSVPYMQKKGVSFMDIYRQYNNENEEERTKWFWENAPLFEVVLDMAVKHLPNPIEAQKYRIPKIWRGESDSKFGQGLINCDKNGEVAFVITKIVIDPRSGKEISAGRLYSGTIVNGMDVYANSAKKKGKIQQVFVYNGVKPEQLEKVPAGNVLAISGLNVDVGETITVNEQTAFEEIRHIFQPVITKSIEVTKSADLPKLIEVLRKVAKEDPSVKIEINEETGENLISGMGELHLEIIEGRIKTEKGLEVKTGPPIVVYRETVGKESGEVEVRTPNGHNIFRFSIEPLENEVYDAIQSGELPEMRLKKKAEEVWKKLSEKGMSNDEARQVKEIYKGNIFEDRTRGIVLLGEIIDSIMDGWKLVVDAGPLAKEPLMKSKFVIYDAKIHVDHMHRGPAQIYPAVRRGMFEAMQKANASILEPIQTHQVEAPVSFMGAVTSLIGSKRGVLIDVQQESNTVVIKAKIPVAEMIGWSSDLRSATEGRGVSSLMDQNFEKLPSSLQADVVRKIRDRKGLAENQ